MSNQENKIWLPITEPTAAIQNLINGCLIAQSKGAYSFEESSILWESMKSLVNLQVQARESGEDFNQTLKMELAKKDDSTENNQVSVSE